MVVVDRTVRGWIRNQHRLIRREHRWVLASTSRCCTTAAQRDGLFAVQAAAGRVCQGGQKPEVPVTAREQQHSLAKSRSKTDVTDAFSFPVVPREKPRSRQFAFWVLN